MQDMDYLTLGLTVAGLIISWYYGYRSVSQAGMSATKKAIAIGAVSKIIYEKAPHLDDDFQTTFRGDIVTRITDNHVFIMNVGNTDISLEDFIAPISLELPETEHMYDCRIIDKRPHDLNAEFEYKNDKIIFSPIHLNSGDYIAVKFLRAGKAVFGRPAGRVKGISNIDYLLPGAYDSWFVTTPLFYLSVGLCTLAFAAWSYWGSKHSGHASALIPGVLALVLIAIAAFHWRAYRVLRTAKYMGKGTEHLEFTPLIREDGH